MDDLRWILLLVGTVVVVAIYFSSRFESEDWSRERKQFAKNKVARPGKKSRKKQPSSKQSKPKQSPVVTQTTVRKEPRMDTAVPATDTPEVSELVIEVSEPQDAVPEDAEVKAIPSGVKVLSEKEMVPAIEHDSKALIAAEITEELSTEEPIEPGIEDEITDVEIPVELAVEDAKLQIEDAEVLEDSVQANISFDIEPLVLSVSVLADEKDVFSGPEIKEALEAEGLQHGAMSIFHFFDPGKAVILQDGDAVFSVANVVEPGFFDLDKLSEIETPGLMLFCQLPGPLAGEAALEIMLDKGRGLAVRLHGQMCDDKRNPFTTQAKTYYKDKIATFNRELELAKKKAET